MTLERTRRRHLSTLSLSSLLSLLVLPTQAESEFPLTLLPIYTQATVYVGGCADTAYSSYITSFGCDSFSNPGPCLCTDALSSSKIAYHISSCAHYRDLGVADVDSATQLWRDYCRTNGGVSIIHDETSLQNIPLLTQVTVYVRECYTSATATLIQTLGCSDYTVASCLCASSDRVWQEASECASSMLFDTDSASQQASGSLMWSSYCQINAETPASRTILAPIKVDVIPTPTSSSDDYYNTATPGSTGDITHPTSNSGSSSGGGATTGGSSSGTKVNWEAIGAVIGVVGILVALGVAWWTNRKNQWAIHAIGRLGWHQHHLQMQQNQLGHGGHGVVQHQSHGFRGKAFWSLTGLWRER